MKNFLLIFLQLFMKGIILLQKNIIDEIFREYDKYKEKTFSVKRIDHRKLISQLKLFSQKEIFTLELAGKSVEEREIYLCRIGKGPVKILAWSQMHGDESTATMALIDLINFFTADDEFNEIREKILNRISFYFIPMLNPDGAVRFRRYNAAEVDLNRDALRLQFPESQILHKTREKIQPMFGFNLHDQSQEYSAGLNKKPAVISFLAPPFNYENQINDVRKRAMKLIAVMAQKLYEVIPNQIGRYSDEFEPRAFGDNFVKRGTSTILIESGWYPNDREKQFVRKLNFLALLEGLNSITNETYATQDVGFYRSIPENHKLMFDLLFRNATLEKGGKSYKIDIGVNFEEKTLENNSYSLESNIQDIGDLSIYSAYVEYDCNNLTIAPGKVYPETIKSLEELSKINFYELYKEGYIYVIAEYVLKGEKQTKFPIIILSESPQKPPETAIDSRADFVFLRSEEIIYVVINGFVIDLSNSSQD